MNKACLNCRQSFETTDDDLAFYDTVSPIIAGTKYPIHPPTHCPDCRQQRRLAICNERFLYPGTCGLCGKSTPTEHPPHNEQPIYCRECWHSDQWDARDYGRDFDFSRPFFEQWVELKRNSPAQALSIQGTNENSEYIHYAGFGKNCYLIMHSSFCEDCYYGYGLRKCTSCVDCFYMFYCEWCYDCVDCHRCYELVGSQDCINCSNSAFLRDCTGCNNCFLCTGLRNAEYCFENQQLSKAEYQAKLTSFSLGSHEVYQDCKSKKEALEKQHIFKEHQGHNLENCIGTHLYNCKNNAYSFDCDDVEDGKFLYQVVIGSKNIHDIYQYGNNLEFAYDCSIVGLDSYRILFCHETHTSSEVLYGWYMENCKSCFGCANMHHQSHCVFNKQYSKEEYEKLVPKIINHMIDTGEWSEFIPPTHTIFGYNKTTAQLFYPLTKEEAQNSNIPWDDYEPKLPDLEKTITANSITNSISDVSDEILQCAIECETSKKLFRVNKQELIFYQRLGLPIPHRAPDQRHVDRFQQRNPRRFWQRTCGNCDKEIITTFSPERPEIVFCEECYLEKTY